MDRFPNKTSISEGGGTALGCHSGSPDLKDHLHFTSDLAPALLSLSVCSSLSPLNGAPDPEGCLLPYPLN